jgi:hypothetical protein
MWRARDRTRNRGGTKSLLSVATAQLGTAPLHYWDFTANRALFNGVDVGAVTSTPNWGFSRASTGYAQTLAGTLVNFGSGVPRITNKGLLVEDARTNLLLQSQTLATAPWIPFQSSITADATAAPDGTTTADKLVEDTTAASTHFHQQIVNLTASVQTFSIYAKAAERTQTSIFVPTTAFADATFRTASFDLTGAGTVLSVTASATASIEALAGGWYRCILNVPATLAVAANIQYGMLVANNPTYTGNGTSGLFLWGAQVEAAATHSSYITTTTVTVTRPLDSTSLTSPSVAYPLSVYTEFNRTIASYPSNTASFNLDDGTANERTTLLVDATASTLQPIVVGAAGITQYNVNISPALGANVTTKLAARVSSASANSARDNVLQTASGAITVPLTPTRLFFGMNPSAAAQLNGYLLRVAIFNTALADAALQRATR